MRMLVTSVAILTATLLQYGAAETIEPISVDNVVAPSANSTDEPIAASYSLGKATHFLDSASLQWQKQRKCFTCHTNLAYLYARPCLPGEATAHREVRSFAEQLVSQRWPDKGPRWDAEVVAVAAALAFNDAKTTGLLHELTRVALDRMWTIQRKDGGWDWLKCEWPPMESDDHYGATLAAIAVGVAPDDYKNTAAARQGMQALRQYFAANPPETLHHEAMLLWASAYHQGLVNAEEKRTCIDKLWKLQKDDGGWALASMGDWRRHDGGPQDFDSSDGYGTGFAVFVLRQAGIAATDPRIERGVQWLKNHQRESGRWFTRSLYKDSHHFISHAGTAFAVMALAECGRLE